MKKKVRQWMELVMFMIKPEDSSAGHVYHDYTEEMPPVITPMVAGALKVLLLVAIAILLYRQIISLFI